MFVYEIEANLMSNLKIKTVLQYLYYKKKVMLTLVVQTNTNRFVLKAY